MNLETVKKEFISELGNAQDLNSLNEIRINN